MKFILLSLPLCLVFFSCKKENVSTNTTVEKKYFPTVKEIISVNCLSCHNSSDPFNWPGAPVKFDSDQDIVGNAASIKASVCDAVSPFNHRMPLGYTLSSSDSLVILKWFEKGGSSSD